MPETVHWQRSRHKMEDGAPGTAPSVRQQAFAEQTSAQSESRPLMFWVAALFAGSTLISLTLLWCAIRAIRWLLPG